MPNLESVVVYYSKPPIWSVPTDLFLLMEWGRALSWNSTTLFDSITAFPADLGSFGNAFTNCFPGLALHFLYRISIFFSKNTTFILFNVKITSNKTPNTQLIDYLKCNYLLFSLVSLPAIELLKTNFASAFSESLLRRNSTVSKLRCIGEWKILTGGHVSA